MKPSNKSSDFKILKMKKALKVLLTVLFLTVFSRSVSAQEMDVLKSPTPPAEKIEPKVMQADLIPEKPAPPPLKQPGFTLPPNVENKMKEQEAEEYRRALENSPVKID